MQYPAEVRGRTLQCKLGSSVSEGFALHRRGDVYTQMDRLSEELLPLKLNVAKPAQCGVESPECLARHGQNYQSLLRVDSTLCKVAEQCGIIILAPSKDN